MRQPLIIAFLAYSTACAQNWPQPAGPHGNWQLTVEAAPPAHFSVAKGHNVLWTASLPEGGQSGIAVWDDRLFLSIMKPAKSANRSDLSGADIVALCMDARDGSLLWQAELKGSAKSPYIYGFSDSTTPGPVTDGEKVWFFNASGNITCFDFEGNLLWQRLWEPVTLLDGVKFPFNKQFEPFLVGDTLVNMEPYPSEYGARVHGWHYLYGLDKNTGAVKWISEDSLTHYNTPFHSLDALGRPTVLIGRGGHHKVPEKPDGYSMIDLATGKRIWQYEVPNGDALYHSAFNETYAVWYTEKANELHVLNARTGTLIKKISLTDKVELRLFDQTTGTYTHQSDVNYKAATGFNVFPGWYTNILIGDQLFFMCFKEGRHRKKIGPENAFARVNLKTGRVEYLEVPVHIKDSRAVWRENLLTDTTNSRGIDVAHDRRSKRDGWHWCFNGNPIAVNDKIYFTLMLGVCYVIDANAADFDQKAVLGINDLGPYLKTWSLNTPSFANGRLYHRTLTELVCIGR